MRAVRHDNGLRTRIGWCVGLVGIVLSAAACGSGDPEVAVGMTEMAFEPSQITIQRGQKTILLLQNKGAVEHNLVVQRQPITSPTVQPGQTARLEIALPPGNYPIVCNIPGHEEAGMTGQITAARGR
jgi:uncharacterized cupredoxin-like copper-binding protein